VPSLNPKIRLNEPVAINAAPRTSMCGRRVVRSSGCMNNSAPTTMIGATMTLIRKAQRQE